MHHKSTTPPALNQNLSEWILRLHPSTNIWRDFTSRTSKTRVNTSDTVVKTDLLTIRANPYQPKIAQRTWRWYLWVLPLIDYRCFLFSHQDPSPTSKLHTKLCQQPEPVSTKVSISLSKSTSLLPLPQADYVITLSKLRYYLRSTGNCHTRHFA